MLQTTHTPKFGSELSFVETRAAIKVEELER
jgi:hypothetical protein